jgi:3-isopropylmalate/(R)-2-methylmalate dehydratase large subunit
MVIEAGGKNGIIEPDQVTVDFVKSKTQKPFEVVKNDTTAKYFSEKVYKSKDLEPVVAKPHSPDNKALVREVEGTPLDRAYIGSCTGGKMTDFIAAAKILNGRKSKIDLFIVPATTHVDRQLDVEKIGNKTLRQIFLEAGGHIGDASCAACLGGPSDTFGRLNKTEVCISTTNRNFPGRMGSKQYSVYLASPYTVASSAIEGKITDPRKFIG